MRAGQLDDRITVKREQLADDGGGGSSITLTTLGTIWARVEAERGQERVIADQQRGIQAYRITVRNNGVGADITTGDRIEYDGQILNVRSAPIVGRAQLRMIEAESGVAP